MIKRNGGGKEMAVGDVLGASSQNRGAFTAAALFAFIANRLSMVRRITSSTDCARILRGV